ncbi:MAG: hypothetical protein AAF986_07235 [Pseudomonadota bacterium]
MTFSNALSNALSGMNAATTAVQVRSNNIANASNPAYARREVVLTSGVIGGVRVLSVERAGDALLLGDRLSADARAADLAARSQAADQINQQFGEPGDERGLFASLTRFESALDDLAATPESGSYQAATLRAAEDVSLTFNRLGDAVKDARTDADRAIGNTVAAVNRALSALQDLNGVAGRGNANGLSDIAEQRQHHIDTIGEALDIRVAMPGAVRCGSRRRKVFCSLGKRRERLSFHRAALLYLEIQLHQGICPALRLMGWPSIRRAVPRVFGLVPLRRSLLFEMKLFLSLVIALMPWQRIWWLVSPAQVWIAHWLLGKRGFLHPAAQGLVWPLDLG